MMVFGDARGGPCDDEQLFSSSLDELFVPILRQLRYLRHPRYIPVLDWMCY